MLAWPHRPRSGRRSRSPSFNPIPPWKRRRSARRPSCPAKLRRKSPNPFRRPPWIGRLPCAEERKENDSQLQPTGLFSPNGNDSVAFSTTGTFPTARPMPAGPNRGTTLTMPTPVLSSPPPPDVPYSWRQPPTAALTTQNASPSSVAPMPSLSGGTGSAPPPGNMAIPGVMPLPAQLPLRVSSPVRWALRWWMAAAAMVAARTAVATRRVARVAAVGAMAAVAAATAAASATAGMVRPNTCCGSSEVNRCRRF